MVALQHRCFWAQKSGNRRDEYEDDFWVVYVNPGPPGQWYNIRAAVSDGASESAFARKWARILTRNFVNHPPEMDSISGERLRGWLDQPRRQWHQQIPWERLPWHGEEKTRAGSHATLLGLAITEPEDGAGKSYWEAIAVGDACLFLVRDDQLQIAFPLEKPEQFDNTPDLICSNPDNQADLNQALHTAGGEFLPEDSFILASDALAQWFLHQCQHGGKPWKTILSIEPDHWETWIRELRDQRCLRNDDVTVLIIQAA